MKTTKQNPNLNGRDNMADFRDEDFKGEGKVKNGGDVFQVNSFPILRKDGSIKGYQYIADNKDFSERIIRKCATRQYEKAFFYVSKDADMKFNSFWSFGKNPDHYYNSISITYSFVIIHK